MPPSPDEIVAALQCSDGNERLLQLIRESPARNVERARYVSRTMVHREHTRHAAQFAPLPRPSLWARLKRWWYSR